VALAAAADDSEDQHWARRVWRARAWAFSIRACAVMLTGNLGVWCFIAAAVNRQATKWVVVLKGIQKPDQQGLAALTSPNCSKEQQRTAPVKLRPKVGGRRGGGGGGGGVGWGGGGGGGAYARPLLLSVAQKGWEGSPASGSSHPINGLKIDIRFGKVLVFFRGARRWLGTFPGRDPK